jgi:hypothetical protein
MILGLLGEYLIGDYCTTLGGFWEMTFGSGAGLKDLAVVGPSVISLPVVSYLSLLLSLYLSTGLGGVLTFGAFKCWEESFPLFTPFLWQR